MRNDPEDQIVDGLENQLTNDVAVVADGKFFDSCKLKAPLHINILELKFVERLFVHKARECRSLKFCDLVDSNVSRGALGKGRSASRAPSRVLNGIGATLVASDLRLVYGEPFLSDKTEPISLPFT